MSRQKEKGSGEYEIGYRRPPKKTQFQKGPVGKSSGPAKDQQITL
ncbi:hypothetical protein [Bradyrhizobium sp. RDM4]